MSGLFYPSRSLLKTYDILYVLRDHRDLTEMSFSKILVQYPKLSVFSKDPENFLLEILEKHLFSELNAQTENIGLGTSLMFASEKILLKDDAGKVKCFKNRSGYVGVVSEQDIRDFNFGVLALESAADNGSETFTVDFKALRKAYHDSKDIKTALRESALLDF